MKNIKVDIEEETELCKIFFKNGSDKCKKILHTYSPVYHEVLKDRRESIESVLEIGVGIPSVMSKIVGDGYEPGASLRSWREYFQNAHIFGLDIDRSVLFEDERISCFFADQTNEASLIESVTEIRKKMNDKDYLFDLIIDDGSHTRKDQILSLVTLKQFLKPDGIYIVEDVRHENLNSITSIVSEDLIMDFFHAPTPNWDNFVLFRKVS